MTTNPTDAKDALLPCPWCAGEPKVKPGKVWHCQLHGDPHQPMIVYCDNPECLVRPSVSAGDKYNSNVRYEAQRRWNLRRNA